MVSIASWRVCWGGKFGGGDRGPIRDCCFIPLAASLGRRTSSAPAPRIEPVELDRECPDMLDIGGRGGGGGGGVICCENAQKRLGDLGGRGTGGGCFGGAGDGAEVGGDLISVEKDDTEDLGLVLR